VKKSPKNKPFSIVSYKDKELKKCDPRYISGISWSEVSENADCIWIAKGL